MHPLDSDNIPFRLLKDAAVLHDTGANFDEPLPWEWFEFRQRPAPIGADTAKTVENGGWRSVWKITLDGHAVPFKFLRRQSNCPLANGSFRPVLMLLHGMGLTIASFRGVSSYLLQTHDLLLPDYSAFSAEIGQSASRNSAPVSFKVFATIVWRIADVLGIDRLSLGGNSLGGGLCLLATLLAPARVERLLLSNPACYPQILPRTYRWARVPLFGEMFMAITAPERFVGGVEYIGYTDKNRFDPALRQIYTQSLSSPLNRLRLMQLMRQLPAGPRDSATAIHLARLRDIHQPVLITWGEQDPLLDPDAGARLAAKLPAAIFERHRDLAHMPHEEAPEQIGPRWAAFLHHQVVGV